MKTIWDIAKLLTGKKKNTKYIHQINVDGTITSDGQIIANSFNNYFLLIIGNCTPVAKGKKPIDYLYQASKEPFPTIEYQNTTTAEIEKNNESLKAKDSHGYDDISGIAVAQWLRCCARHRKVAGLIPDGVIGIFY